MTGIEYVDLGGRQVLEIGVGAGLGEERVVAAPQDQRRRLVLAQPLLECGIAFDIGVVVQGQVDLNFLAPGQIEEVLVERPAVRGDPGRVCGAALVLAARHGQDQDLPHPVLGSLDTGPVRRHPAGEIAQALVVGIGVLDDQAGEPFGAPGGQSQSHRSAEIEQIGHESVETEGEAEPFDGVRDPFERIRRRGPVGIVAVAESGIVRCYQPVPGTECVDQPAELV